MPCFLQTLYTFAPANSTRGVAQLVSAPRSGRGGRKFESSHPDINKSDNRSLRLSLLFSSTTCRRLFLLEPFVAAHQHEYYQRNHSGKLC